MICLICGCFYCNDEADEITTGSRGPKNCCDSPSCRRTYRNRKKQRAPSYKKHKITMRNKTKRRQRNHERGKKHYPSKSVAQQKLAEIMSSNHMPNPGVYYCCELGWSITSDITGESKIRPEVTITSRHLTQTIIFPDEYLKKMKINSENA